MSYAVLALLGILLILALVAFGLGQRRWSLASAIASFLVVLALVGYLFLAARLLSFEWKWAESVRAKQARLHELEDALRPSPSGRLEPIPGKKSLTELEAEKARWDRALGRIDTWRGRRWEKASFEPPEADDQLGTLTLPPPAKEPPPEGDAAAETAAAPVGTPLDPGMTLYLFDDTPASEGGRYLGSFSVDEVTPAGGGGQTVMLRQTAPRDPYDTKVWQQAYDNVSVFDQLPTDRWTAFTTTPTDEPADAGIAPTPRKRSLEEIEAEALLQEQYREELARHALTPADVAEAIPEAEWLALREGLADGRILAGEYWAVATFKESVDRNTFLGLDQDGDSLDVEMELGTAFDLQDEGKVSIEKVFYRRPLRDAETIVHGSVMPEGDGAGANILADGLAGLMRSLRRDIAALEESNRQLEVAQQKADEERKLLGTQADELGSDLTQWDKDVKAAERTAAAFAAAAEAAARRLADTERALVELGRQLDAEIGRAVEEIDQVAPPPSRGAGRAAPPG
jgi:hypothetical protein